MEQGDATFQWSVFLRSLLRCTERAAHIARNIRSEESLFSLLVEEKTGNSKTKLSGADFKTLADVLIQCCIVAQLEYEFPSLSGHVHGEEEASFTNQNGETVKVAVDICANPQDQVALHAAVAQTSALLCAVLDNNVEAARALATAVHQPLDTRVLEDEVLRAGISGDVCLDRVALWIDPIDNTSGYISGIESADHSDHAGIHCVTVLLGVYDISTKLPVAGVVSQPFYHRDNAGCWRGRTLWGVADGDVTHHSKCLGQQQSDGVGVERDVVVIGSRNESPALITAVEASAATAAREESSGRQVRFSCGNGAGYKALCVVTSVVDAYLLSNPSTYLWDTCAVQAILASTGGLLLDYDKALKAMTSSSLSCDLSSLQLLYSAEGNRSEAAPKCWCNSGGLLAVRDADIARLLLCRCSAIQHP